MTRRPFAMFTVVLLAAVAVQGAVVALRTDARPSGHGADTGADGGQVCTVCGPLPGAKEPTASQETPHAERRLR